MNTPNQTKIPSAPAYLLTCALVLAAPASGAATITGSVTNSASADPVARAVVVFVAADGHPSATRTDSDGAYSIELDDGSYTRRVQAPGYTLDQADVNVSAAMTSNATLVALANAPTPLPTFGLPTQNATLTADLGTPGVYYAGSGFANTLYRTFDAGESWTAVTRVSEDERGIDGTFQGFLRPTITTSGIGGEVATVSLTATGTGGRVWFSRDYGTTWTEVDLPAGHLLEPSGTAALRWVHVPGGAEFLVLQPAGYDATLWVADLAAPNPAFTQLSLGVNPLSQTGGKYWDAWNLEGTPALAVVGDNGAVLDVYVWADINNVTSLTKLGDSVALSPAVTTPAFFDVGGVNGNVMVVGGLDNASPYPWPQTLAVIAKPAAAANFDTAFVNVQSVDNNVCYLPGTGIVAPTATYEDARALVGVSACPVRADPDGEQSVSIGSATGALMPAYDGAWNGTSNQMVLGIAGRGIHKATSESGLYGGPAFGNDDKVVGITAPQVRATRYGPAGPQQLAMALDSAGGKRIIASDDGGASFTDVVDAGGYAVDWWRGESAEWLVAGHSGAEAGLLTAVPDWNSAALPLLAPNQNSANQATLSPDGFNSDVRALLGVDGTDTLFVGTFQYPGYMGALYRGTLSGGDFASRVAIPSSDGTHPLATIQDLAYCPAEGSAASVAGTLFVATGYLGLVDGGLYAVRDALTSLTPVATPVTALPFAERAVTDVVVDCQTGALTVGAASDPGVFHSTDGGASFDNVQFPDVDTGIAATDTFQAAAIAANPENPDHILIVANEADDSYAAGFMFETTDGGETWSELIDPSAVDDNGNHESENTLVNDIALPPAEPSAPQARVLARVKDRAARPSIRRLAAPGGVSLAPLALGTQAGGTAITLDVGARRAVPGAPQATTASAGNAQIRVQWQAPSEPGSRPITSYTAQCSASGKPTRTASSNGAARQVQVTNLLRGTRYACNVRALSILGAGAPSDDATATTATLPGVPRNVVASAQSKAIKLTYLAPVSSGGARITKYKATCTAPGKTTKTLEKSGLSMTVTGLVSKVKYKCSMRASNEVGYGAASAGVSATPK